MCFDSDLFGDVIVRVNEINIWLDYTARLNGRTITSRNYYAEFYDVANKIKLSKLNGSFKKLIEEHEKSIGYDSQPLNFYATKYVECEPVKLCPPGNHFCTVADCPGFISRMAKYAAHSRAHERYQKIKAKKTKAAKVV